MLGRFGLFRVVLTRFGSFWLVVGLFWLVLACFRLFWITLACVRSPFGSIWLVSGCFGSFWLVSARLRSLPSFVLAEYNAIFKHIHQNIRIYSRSEKKKKKSALINYLENIAYWEESEQSKALTNKFLLFQIQLEGSRGSRKQGKFCSCYLHLSLETVFPALKRTQICYINMDFLFL